MCALNLKSEEMKIFLVLNLTFQKQEQKQENMNQSPILRYQKKKNQGVDFLDKTKCAIWLLNKMCGLAQVSFFKTVPINLKLVRRIPFQSLFHGNNKKKGMKFKISESCTY